MSKAVLLTVLCVVLAACGSHYSDGVRAGVVTKFAHKGLFCKTWEGELLMGGVRQQTDEKGNSSSVANVWDFSVTDPAVARQVAAAFDAGQNVTLTYNQWMETGFCGGDSNYIVERVSVTK